MGNAIIIKVNEGRGQFLEHNIQVGVDLMMLRTADVFLRKLKG